MIKIIFRWGFILGMVLLFFAYVYERLLDAEERRMADNAAILSDVIRQCAYDRSHPGPAPAKNASPPPGGPFASGAKTTRQYFNMLVEAGYLGASDLERLRTKDMIVTNTADEDPSGTILLVSRGYYNYMMTGGKRPRRYFIIRESRDDLGGDEPFTNKDLPPRSPQFLPP